VFGTVYTALKPKPLEQRGVPGDGGPEHGVGGVSVRVAVYHERGGTREVEKRLVCSVARVLGLRPDGGVGTGEEEETGSKKKQNTIHFFFVVFWYFNLYLCSPAHLHLDQEHQVY
jgi:hypothetical protein